MKLISRPAGTFCKEEIKKNNKKTNLAKAAPTLIVHHPEHN